MRRSLVLLITVVLLLRGWMGEAVAADMLSHQLQSHPQAVAAMQAHGVDCPGAVADEQALDPADADSCAQCQACSLHAMPVTSSTFAPVAPQSQDVRPATAFSSAEPLQGSKPPIG